MKKLIKGKVKKETRGILFFIMLFLLSFPCLYLNHAYADDADGYYMTFLYHDCTLSGSSDAGYADGDNHVTCNPGVEGDVPLSDSCNWSIPMFSSATLFTTSASTTYHCAKCSIDAECDDHDQCTKDKCDKSNPADPKCTHNPKCDAPLTCNSTNGNCILSDTCTLVSASGPTSQAPAEPDQFTGTLTYTGPASISNAGMTQPDPSYTISQSGGCTVSMAGESYTVNCDPDSSVSTCNFSVRAEGTFNMGGGSTATSATYSCEVQNLTAQCPKCGNTIVEDGEICDDGNKEDCNGPCSGNCLAEQSFDTTTVGFGGCVAECQSGGGGGDNKRTCSSSISQTNKDQWVLDTTTCYCNVCNDPEMCT